MQCVLSLWAWGAHTGTSYIKPLHAKCRNTKEGCVSGVCFLFSDFWVFFAKKKLKTSPKELHYCMWIPINKRLCFSAPCHQSLIERKNYIPLPMQLLRFTRLWKYLQFTSFHTLFQESMWIGFFLILSVIRSMLCLEPNGTKFIGIWV